MATIKVFTAEGIKELNCFDNYDLLPYLDDEEDDQIVDDGELTVSNPL